MCDKTSNAEFLSDIKYHLQYLRKYRLIVYNAKLLFISWCDCTHCINLLITIFYKNVCLRTHVSHKLICVSCIITPYDNKKTYHFV